MLTTPSARRGMVVAPHHLAAQAGLDILRAGGNAVEAMVAAAAAIAVVYPHMTALGGDGFWLIRAPGQTPIAIRACGAAGSRATIDFYRTRGLGQIPARGPLAANTVAGTVSGWQAALDSVAADRAPLPLCRLFEDAIHLAEAGVPATASQCRYSEAKLAELDTVPGFARTFLRDGRLPRPGETMRQPALAATLRELAASGLDGFYRGRLARKIAADLERVGSPVSLADLAAHRAVQVKPLSLRVGHGIVYNHPPPTQGLASLMILGLFDRLAVDAADGFAHLHGLIEATKLAFRVRNAHVTDPAHMTVQPEHWLEPARLDRIARLIDPGRARPWPDPSVPGDTIWMGAIDAGGLAVSFIQSIYWEFGSGVVLSDTGLLWQNRGSSFVLAEGQPTTLAPGKLPFHTLNPALALFDDGRVLSYGTMGGEGQPQTQAAVYTRAIRFGQSLQAAITAPRWLLGRSWGAETVSLRLESRFPSAVVDALRGAGHPVEMVGAFDDLMGHAHAVMRHADGRIEGAVDPRSDGQVAAF